ncbi:MAG: DUF1446 domain-containing protein [Acidimicrobiia bacterium]|nr:DUF1446 domain-containing protein [Acidimicrobiia bacterium]
MSKRPIRIANFSGFFGDRVAALRDQLEGGEIDVLSGDYLAELTMLILAKTRTRRADGGYARTFVEALSPVLGEVLDRRVKVVVNAGGLDPRGAAVAIRQLASDQGLTPRVAAISGDDLMGRLGELQSGGEEFVNLQTGERLSDSEDGFITANAYMGGWGITQALAAGADIIVTGRVADASVVSGPAAWWHGWERHDYDRLAGAVAAGHVIECGMQATGGNYSFFTEIEDLAYPAFPWAEIAADGSSVIGKHDGTGGRVSIGTVVSQLLYEIGPPAYLTPDVVARFDTVRLEEIAPDRVGLSGTRGEAPPTTLKVAASVVGGYRNSMMIGLTGLNQAEKAALVSQQVWRAMPWKQEEYDEVDESIIGQGSSDPKTNAEATSFWRIAVKSTDPEKVGRAFSDSAISVLLGSIPGMFSASPPAPASQFARYWPTTVDRTAITQEIDLDGTIIEVRETTPEPGPPVAPLSTQIPSLPIGETRTVPLGELVGARSGDKGGTGNIGVFARKAEAYAWIADVLTVERLRSLMPDLAHLNVERYLLPNLWSLNFVIHGLLGEGVSSSLRIDAQAKGLAEYLRACRIEVPTSLLD